MNQDYKMHIQKKIAF